MKQKLVLLFFMLCCVLEAESQTIFARSNGDWDQTSVWSTIGTGGATCGCTPAPGDDVLIDGYDVDIDGGTGDVTVNSIVITNARSNDVRLRVQAGSTLTVTTDFEIESDSGGNDAELTVVGTGSGLDVLGNFLGDQNDGDDLLIDIDDNSIVNISGDVDFLQDGGDDFELNINQNSGTAAQWNVAGDMTFDHNGGDDYRIRVDDASSVLDIGGDIVLLLNSGLDDDLNFNCDGGNINVDGDILVTRALTYGLVLFDLDGGDINCDEVVVNSSGALFSLGAVQFIIDQTSEFNCNDFTSSFVGADDLYIHLNQNAGTSAEFNVANDMVLTRTAGDDIEIYISEDGELNVGNDFSITSSGPDSEELEIELTDSGVLDVGGDFTVDIIDGEDVAGNLYRVLLEGGGSSPLFHVGGNFSWTSSINLVDNDFAINGGVLDVDGDMTVTQNAGAEDLDLDIDDTGSLTVGGNLVINLNGGDDLSFNLGTNLAASSGSCTVIGNCTLTHNLATASSSFEHRVVENSRFTVNGDLSLITNFASSPGLTQDIQNTAEVIVGDDVNLTATAGGELEISLEDDAFFRIGGNFVRASIPSNFGALSTSDNGTVEYNGSTAQIIAEDAGAGGDTFFYTNLEIDNSFGTIPQLTLEGEVTVHGDLTMNDGVVASDVTDILIVADDGTTSNASDDSYVDGYMRKVGNEAFTFPSGDAGFYAPIGISAPSVATEQFEAQYFNVRPNDDGFDETMFDPSLDHISFVEYWKLNQTSGASTPTVTLSWGTPRSGGVVNESDLRFARWDGSNWDDHGAASITGTPDNGTLDNSVGISAFSDSNPYTLGTIDPINPLPIELISFTAQAEDAHVRLKWRTKSEINCDHFILEKSADGFLWNVFAQVDGAGNSSVENNYFEIDENPFPGLSYYRLKQTDFDGTTEYFGPISVEGEETVVVYPNPANGLVFISGSVGVENVKLYSMLGQEIQVNFISSSDMVIFNTESLPSGTYYIRFGQTIKPLVVSH